MASFKFVGLDEYAQMLSKLAQSDTIRAVCGATIYAGADIVADKMREGIGAIPTIDEKEIGDSANKLRGITAAQKEGLEESFGIAPMGYENGYYHVKLGFDGYNSVKTKKYPNGQPNSLIARSVNSGTSFRQKIPFVDSAVRRTKSSAEQAMKKKFDEEIKKYVKGD